MLSINPRFGGLTLCLLAREMQKLRYWGVQPEQTALTDALVRFYAVSRSIRDKEAFNQGLLISIGKEAQKRRDALIDGIDDDAILTPEQQEDIYNQFQEYQRIIFRVSDLLEDA